MGGFIDENRKKTIGAAFGSGYVCQHVYDTYAGC
jgi:hypothetical protein